MKPREEMIRDLVRQWFAKADLDMGLAEHIVGEATLFIAATGFHCQQAAEKYLKAFLVHHQLEFPKTHDLGDLLDLVERVDVGLAAELKSITFLNPYGVDFRYPSDLPSMTVEEAHRALELARKVQTAVQSRIGK
ncbi:MAG: HEPN domain-containing protein [Deltaproteobacteria bacterium]|nr:HEPN domain-containing protein [Deltaproteobacteria bacterium]